MLNLARNKAVARKRCPAWGRKRHHSIEKAMHEENFLSSWLRESGKSKTKREMEVDKEVREGVGEKGKRVREKGEDEMVVKRKCVNQVSVQAFQHFQPR